MMIRPLPPLRLSGAQILRDGLLQPRSLALAEGRITRGPLPAVDLTGYLVLPGVIDLFGCAADAASHDRAAAAAGITTAFLAQRWGWLASSDAPAAAEARLAELAAYRLAMRCDLRLHLCAEANLVDHIDRLAEVVRRHRIGFVSFENRLDSLLDLGRADPAAFARLAPQGAAPLMAELEAAHPRRREVLRALCLLAEGFDDLGVLYATRADPDGETRERHSMIGARIALFPASRRAAVAARAMMSPVILPAPEVLARGAAAALMAEGLADALASDGDPAALVQAAFAVADQGRVSFDRAWRLISGGPAEILRLADRGHLNPGGRADLTIVNAATRQVEATISRGRLIHVSGDAAQRFAPHLPRLLLAAE